MDHLAILWTNDNKEVFFNMIAMYALNSKKEGWWKEVTLIIWGPTAKLSAQDTQVQTELKELIFGGVKIEACKACADNYFVSDKLESLGVEVKYMGLPLTGMLKNNMKILTF